MSDALGDPADDLRGRRLGPGDRDVARATFALLAAEFGEGAGPLGDAYVDALLARAEFWALAATRGGELAGGLTAHTLPMTRAESREVFIFDIAVRAARRRAGVGRALVDALRRTAAAEGVGVVFVAADADDADALDFYRALGGVRGDAAVFTFGGAPGGAGRTA